ncbi:MAG: uracil-DNA glycosylase family protein [Patescibacteria group bacterium]|jgi:uracil-DNA glycosylase
MVEEIHNCGSIQTKPPSFFFQPGVGVGSKVLILGESLARNGWVNSGKAFYTPEGKLVPTGKRLNEELAGLNLTLERCAFTEIAKCYIGNNRKILKSCGLRSGDHLLSQVSTYPIKIIFSLGVITKDILEEVFGVKLVIGEINPVVYQYKKLFILPLWHPSPASPHGHNKNLEIILNKRNKIKRILL